MTVFGNRVLGIEEVFRQQVKSYTLSSDQDGDHEVRVES